MSCESFLYPHTCSPDACLGEHYYIHLSVHQMRFSVIIISVILGGGYPQSYLHSSPSKTSSSADDTLFRFLQAHQTKPGGYGLTRGDEGQRYLNSRAVHKQIVWKRFQVAASHAYWRRAVTWNSRSHVVPWSSTSAFPRRGNFETLQQIFCFFLFCFLLPWHVV